MDLRTAEAVTESQRNSRSKLGLDRRSQPAEKTSRQTRVVAENDPVGVGTMSTIRHVLDITSRRRFDNKRELSAVMPAKTGIQ
jgi:hypothetical protein